MTDWRIAFETRIDAELRVRRSIVSENQQRIAELEEIQREFKRREAA